MLEHHSSSVISNCKNSQNTNADGHAAQGKAVPADAGVCMWLCSGLNIRGTMEPWSIQQLGNGSNYEALVAPEWLAGVAELPWLRVRTAFSANRDRTCPSLTAGCLKTNLTAVPCAYFRLDWKSTAVFQKAVFHGAVETTPGLQAVNERPAARSNACSWIQERHCCRRSL